MMGSPIVVHTAPPQPASKARMTWYAVLVGGPEASQKGFGDRTPQKLMLRSGIGSPSALGFQRLMNSCGSLFAMRDRVHDFSAAVHAISAGIVPGIARAHARRINNYAAIL